MSGIQVSGLQGAIIEILIFAVVATGLRSTLPHLHEINGFTYYWLSFTVLTGIWEFCFVTNYDKVAQYSKELIAQRKHVWNLPYGLSMLWPSKLSYIFYAEYGAYADREYMDRKNDWSRIIESTHAIFCGLFSFLGLMKLIACGYTTPAVALIAVAMGSQLMNSILYMSEYFIQTQDIDNPNYSTPGFPTGKWLLKRPFMYVNLFWTLMPAIIIKMMV